MAWPPRARGTGTAQRESEIAKLANQPCGIEPVAMQVQVAAIALLKPTVERPPLTKRRKRHLEQPRNMRQIGFAPLIGDPRCRSQPDAQGRRQGARPKARLLPPAMEQRRRLASLADPQAADAFGAVDLVSGYGDQIGSLRQIDPPEPLAGQVLPE